MPRVPAVLPSLLLALGLLMSACAGPESPAPAETATPPPPAAPPEEEIADDAEAPPLAAEPDETEAAAAPVPAGPTRVALLVPLSGDAASAGEGLFNAAQLALFQLGGPDFELLPIDTGGTPEGAAAAARAAVARGADLILGPLFSASVKAAAPVARTAGLPVVAFTTDRSAAGDGVFVFGFLPGPQVERIVAHARAQGLQRFAALAPDTASGRAVVEILRALDAKDEAMSVEAVELYDPASDASEEVRRLAFYEQRQNALADYRRLVQQHAARVVPPELPEDMTPRRLALEIPEVADIEHELRWLDTLDTLGQPPYDAIVLPDEGSRLRNVAALLPYYDIDTRAVRLLGTMLWDDPGLAREPALVGGWYPARPPESYRAFADAYRRAFGAAPPSIASLGFDATALAAVLAAHPDLDLSARSLRAPSGFAGIDGIFRFRPDGTAERGLAVMEINPEGPLLLDPAPDSFEAIDRRRRQQRDGEAPAGGGPLNGDAEEGRRPGA